MTKNECSKFAAMALIVTMMLCLSFSENHKVHSFSLSQARGAKRATVIASLGAATSASENDESKTKKMKMKVQPPQEPRTMDVSKLDIRVGLIEKCWEHEEADKLYCEEINLGEEGGPRLIASGLKAHYSADEMVGKKVLVLANLKSRKLVGFPSHGMVLCACKYGEAEDGSEDTVEIVSPPQGAEIGDRVVCDGFDGEPATENQVVKKKILNAVFPDLKVDANGVAIYKGVPLRTATGGETCEADSLKDVPIS